MRLWNSKRYRKPRPTSRVGTFFNTSNAYDDGDDHAFSTSSNGYGPQVISDSGFRPNDISTHPIKREVVPETSAGPRSDSPVNGPSSIKRKHLEPWSASAVSGLPGTDASPSQAAGNQHRRTPAADGTLPGDVKSAERVRQAHQRREDALIVSRDGLWSWIPHVAQSADDGTVLFRVNEVFLFAEQFVNNFYTDGKPTDAISLEALDKVNRSELLPKGQLQGVLVNAVYPTVLIKHVLLSLVLDMISFALVGNEGCLLPKEFRNYIALAQATTRSSADDTPHMQPALSAYRVLSAYVHPNFDSDRRYLEDKQQISEKVAADFRSAFDQWLGEDKSKEFWESSFHLLVDKTARLGTFLFSQPSVFIFDWETSSEDRSAQLVPVHPRLLRVFDEEGQLRDVSDEMIPMKLGQVFEGSFSEVEE